MRRRIGPLARSLATAALLAGCDDTFRPFEPGGVPFSVFGYLDASADTQWIRVMPVRTLVIDPAAPLPGRVTLEHLGTERVIELRDSVFQFDYVDPELESEGLFLHNFWTTERIEPGASYRFTLRADDGSTSESVIQVPPHFEVEVWRGQNASQPDLFHLIGLKHVALVGTSAYFTDGCGPSVQHDAYTHTAVDSIFHRIPPFPPLSSRTGCQTPRVSRRELWVAGSGTEWPRGAEHMNARLNVPDGLSNVSRSMGFLGGVLVRRVPAEACLLVIPVGVQPARCIIRYNPSTAVLTGTIEDARCGGPVQGVTVQLVELVPPPYRIRPTSTDPDGRFEVAGLETGRRYALSIRQVVAGADVFEEYGDTLQFAPGERRVYDAKLNRIERCQ